MKKSSFYIALISVLCTAAVGAVLFIIYLNVSDSSGNDAFEESKNAQYARYVEREKEVTDLENMMNARIAVELYVAENAVSANSTFKVVLDSKSGVIKVNAPRSVKNKAYLKPYGYANSDCIAKVLGSDWDEDVIFTYENYTWSDNATRVHGKYYWADGKTYK